MKLFLVIALLVAAAAAAPASLTADAQALVLRNDIDNIGVDGFNAAYETSNGIKAEESGRLENQGTPEEGIEVQGSYSYPGPDGVLYTVIYTAGKNGFQPQGAHIPQA